MRSEVFTILGNFLYLYLCNKDMAVKQARENSSYPENYQIGFLRIISGSTGRIKSFHWGVHSWS